MFGRSQPLPASLTWSSKWESPRWPPHRDIVWITMMASHAMSQFSRPCYVCYLIESSQWPFFKWGNWGTNRFMALAWHHTANKEWGQDSNPGQFSCRVPTLILCQHMWGLNSQHSIITEPFFPLGMISIVSLAYDLLKDLQSISNQKHISSLK